MSIRKEELLTSKNGLSRKRDGVIDKVKVERA